MVRIMKSLATAVITILFTSLLAGCFGTTLTTGGGRIDSPAGTLIIKDESFSSATNQDGSQAKQKELTLTLFKEDTSQYSSEEYDKIMAKKFSLKDSSGNSYDLAYSGLDDDDFMLMIGFTFPESASGFKLKYPDSNPIILRH